MFKNKKNSITYIKAIETGHEVFFHLIGDRIHREIIDYYGSLKKIPKNFLHDKRRFDDLMQLNPTEISATEFEELWARRRGPAPSFENIIRDWKTRLPTLSNLSQRKFAMRVGPMLIGVCIINNKRMDSYHIGFMIIPLWETDKVITNDSIFYSPVYRDLDKKHPETAGVNYASHYFLLDKNIDRLYNQFGSLLNEEILLSDLWNKISYFDNISLLKEWNAITSLRLKMVLAVYFDRNDLIECIKDETDKLLSQIEASRFKNVLGISQAEWLNQLNHWINHRQELLNIVEENSKLPKVAKLKKARIINDPFVPGPLPAPKRETFRDKLKRIIKR